MIPRVAIVVPAYRPDEAPVRVVSGVIDLDAWRLVDRIVVVDDGSGPAYAGFFDKLRVMPRVEVLTRAENGGKGVALKAGIAHVLASRAAMVGLVTADADGQHAPADILRVAHALVERPDRLVLGVRQFDRTVPLRNRLGNVVTRRLVRWRTGVSLRDTQTGLRGWPLAMAAPLLEIPGARFDWEFRALLSTIHTPIEEVPIATIYGTGRSTFHAIRDSIRVCAALLRVT